MRFDNQNVLKAFISKDDGRFVGGHIFMVVMLSPPKFNVNKVYV